MKPSILPFAFLLSLPLVGAGCQSLECGAGSVQQGDRCVPSELEVVCGAGTELVGGNCVAMEEGDFAYCGGKYRNTVVDESGACQQAGGKAGSNAGVVVTMELTRPAMFATDANIVIAPDLQARKSLTYVGVHQVGASPYRIWGGVDSDVTDGKGALKAMSGYDVAATVTGMDAAKRLTTEQSDMSIQLLGYDTILEDAEILEGELDETGPFTMLKKFKLRGVLTPANANKVSLGDTPLDQAIDDAPDVNQDGTGAAESWTFEAVITTGAEIVTER